MPSISPRRCGRIILGNIKPDYTAAENYLRAFYWVITTFATIGYGDITPANVPQIARSKYQEKSNCLNLFLEYRDIPVSLREKLRRYYCDLYTLDKDSFQVVLTHFPAFARQVRKMAMSASIPGNTGPNTTPRSLGAVLAQKNLL